PRPQCGDRADRPARLRSDRERLASVIAVIENAQTQEAIPPELALALRLACRVETEHSRQMRSANRVALTYENTYASLTDGRLVITEQNLSPMLELIIGGLLLQKRLTITEKGRYIDSSLFRAMLLTIHLSAWELPEQMIE